jgi:hypothetical protein
MVMITDKDSSEKNDDDKKFTYGLYRPEIVEDPTGGFNFGNFSLQDYYGTRYMPSLNFVNLVKTGQVTYDSQSDVDKKHLEDYKEYVEKVGQPMDLPTPGEIMANEVSPYLGQMGESVGSSLATGGSIGEGFKSVLGVETGMSVPEGTTSFNLKKLADFPDAKPLLDKAGMNLTGDISTSAAETALGGAKNVQEVGGVVGRDLMRAEGVGFSERINPFDPSGAGAQNLKGAVGGAVGNFAVQLALGRDPMKAAKSAGAGAIGKMIGTAIMPGIGGFIGGALGSILGGRVICNELMRQGLLTRKQVVMDYKFTRDYLTPTHVNGYHIWAVWMVKQMRKGKYVKFWKHVAGHRANEIAYIYGERDKPDYLGKIYRKILEPTCWVVGAFCKKTDWSILYKQKEI